SRQMGSNEARMLRLLDIHNQVVQHAVADHHGTVIKVMGDAFLVDFPSVVHAVQCAQRIQDQFRTYNAEAQKTEQIHVRIGIHLGDIVQRDGDVFGDGVNIASRLQDLAEPDTICISDMVYRDVVKKLDLGTAVSVGRPKLKNIAERFAVYALLPEQRNGFRHTLRVQWLKLKRKKRVWQMAAAVLVLGLVSAGTLLIKSFYFASASNSLLRGSTPIPSPSLPFPDKPSIVILPFANLSNDPEQEYFSDGITEVLTSDLSRIASLFVIARNTAFTYKGKATNVRDVGRELGVHYVLEGSVQKASEQVRIVAQLIDTTTGGHIWSERYDRPLQAIFALQDEIVQKIATTLNLQLTLLEQGILVRKTTDNLEAYDSYLRGMEYFYRYTKETMAQARQMFEKAIALDPQYAQAYASLSWTYWLAVFFQWSQDPQDLERAFVQARKAVALDDSLPFAHTTLGWVYLMKKQHDQAVAEAERAIILDPNSAQGYVMLGDMLIFTGRPEETVGLMEKAMRLDPHYPPHYLNILGFAYLMMGRYEDAIAPLKKALSRHPDLLQAHANLAVVYSELGREEEARAEAAEFLRLSPNFSLEMGRQIMPAKDPAVLDRYLNALRKAGLK
ncbi:MAG: adenylate/guanylate cyclase domain-containing protein, partial [Deltaproteobacteria bacterium]|nr:adenylate/guanylate cyclase domain-containing protein [Deltaproteobacteria bacterium]